jgi:hypothetical protein
MFTVYRALSVTRLLTGVKVIAPIGWLSVVTPEGVVIQPSGEPPAPMIGCGVPR